MGVTGDHQSWLTSGMQLWMVQRDNRDMNLGDYLPKDLSFCHEQGAPFPGDPTQPVHRHCLEQHSQERRDVTGGAVLPQARALQQSAGLGHPLPWRSSVCTYVSCKELMAEHGTCYSGCSKPGYEGP